MNQSNTSRALPKGYKLFEYEIIEELGSGGFGITYKAIDKNLKKTVVIKEYIPNGFAYRDNSSYVMYHKGEEELFLWGKKKFIQEAQLLASFEHPSIAKVYRFFEANNTAYFIMPYFEGETLEEYLKHNKDKKFTHEEILDILMPIVEGIKAIHKVGIIHGDIAPDNIFLRKDGLSILIDFGAAKNALGNKSQLLTKALVKKGYSPPEQYSTGSLLNSSSDIYALSAVFYKMITGETPPESTRRQTTIYNGGEDPIKNIVDEYKDKYPQYFLETIQKGLELKQKERIQNINEFQEGIIKLPSPPPPPPWKYIIAGIAIISIAAFGGYYFAKSQKPKPVPPTPVIVVKSCEENNITDCIKKADSYLKQNQLEQAKIYYEKACNLGDNDSCNKKETIIAKIKKNSKECNSSISCIKMADKYYYGNGGDKNYSKALQLYKKSCEYGNAEGCLSVGYMYDLGKGTQKNYSKALEYYKKGCDKNSAESCDAAGTIYQNENSGLTDNKKAFYYYKKSCDLGYAGGCSDLGYMYRHGLGTKRDDYKAFKLYKKACENNNKNGCNNTGFMYENGYGVDEDREKAIYYYKKACDMGVSDACSKVQSLKNENSNSKSTIAIASNSSDSNIKETYIAKLSRKDHYNSWGNRLTKVSDILQQDRANYHKYHKRDSQDEYDSYFSTLEHRQQISNMLNEDELPRELKDSILEGEPVVKVIVTKDNTIGLELLRK